MSKGFHANYINRADYRNIWLLTDTHFGHANIIKYCGRPEEFEKLILEEAAKVEKNAEDLFVHLGDVAFRDSANWHKQLLKTWEPAQTLLVKGNHDKGLVWSIGVGWQRVVHALFVEMKDGKQILLTHEPCENQDLLDKCSLNIHGHLHNTVHHEWNPNSKHRLYALEYEGYKPKQLESFL